MKPALERALLQRWYGGHPAGPGLRLLAGLYRAIVALRAACYRAGVCRTRRLPVPVIVVGNFSAGGSGKTPLIMALAQALTRHGYRPGIVSRGYGRRSKRPLQVQGDTPPDQAGDEPKLIFERTGLPVFVDADRAAAAERAMAAGCDLILADDGLQHHRLARDIEIEVFDNERRYGNGLLLPAGPLREAPRACDFRVVNGGTGQAGDWSMRLRLSDAVALSGSRRRNLIDFSVAPVHAVAGIGHPKRFFDALRQQGLTVVEHPFPDHHRYRAADFEAMGGDILMTEKDAVKCRALGLTDAWAVPVEAELTAGFFEAVLDKLKTPSPSF